MIFPRPIQPEIPPQNNDPLIEDDEFEDVSLFFLFAPLSAAITGLIAQGGYRAVSYFLNRDVTILGDTHPTEIIRTAEVVGYVFALACCYYTERDT